MYADASVSKKSIAIADKSPPIDQIRLPPGFSIEIYAENVTGARQMALSPNGTLYVGTRQAGKVYAIPDANRDGIADDVITIISGLKQPAGVEFRNSSLYVAEVERVLRYDEIDGRLDNVPAPVVVISGFPETPEHAWKHIRFGPDGLLYIPVGAPVDVIDTPENPMYSSIMRMNPDGTGLEVFASGVRNTLGLDWDPVTGYLWFTENGHNSLNDTGPMDEVNCAPAAGMHFGYPYVHGPGFVDPVYGGEYNLSLVTPPELDLPPHVAPLGLRFYTGTMFPAEYQNQILIAEHGSLDQFKPAGYRIELVTLNERRKAIGRTVFAEGWLQGDKAWGRPVDLLVMPDGSLLVSDDRAGVIYRITYNQHGGA
ncbi:PQQ-dependent sugar dehydrogenase [Methanocella arvoryzae]|uniref:L-sorbosone dehydrogenase n=1 Tax=Methanocella arvoryzae (strain DSM 22066 / NBRC 105507 / MRE50) TaxID=351160 RepID=Q0W8G0_METAR|nr:putative L-sorbosone dehydrogenase [Methanocella arvoryzae MRE50]